MSKQHCPWRAWGPNVDVIATMQAIYRTSANVDTFWHMLTTTTDISAEAARNPISRDLAVYEQWRRLGRKLYHTRYKLSRGCLTLASLESCTRPNKSAPIGLTHKDWLHPQTDRSSLRHGSISQVPTIRPSAQVYPSPGLVQHQSLVLPDSNLLSTPGGSRYPNEQTLNFLAVFVQDNARHYRSGSGSGRINKPAACARSTRTVPISCSAALAFLRLPNPYFPRLSSRRPPKE
ncbi:hypothetical protein EDD36DRAFT_100220 [Exophiala viscosa]|uniref:Uncharacterized protein n=1 Tax=Exophiala viscosa TaxID=2486360 RepID=A0AAN6IA89_9EURO|nr:hypothetical protein EDD36DRAFT_100220 [Exophiala viscosa]